MPARPSIVIGLGTTGSIIATKVYQSYLEYLEISGGEKDLVQFLLIDTQDPIKGF